ncbi:Zinc finger, RING-type [Dillenia turbinata]|uniref:RING-type E3 ubiquitin transferase n=1 Tax=Dillenia turbinata TaxID=194707 RepID=A0AAN8V7G7_9MAGN
MDQTRKEYSVFIHVSQALSPIPDSIFQNSYHSSSDTSFPILAIAIIGIISTAILLVSYYVFVIKCCLNWHRIDLLRRFSLSRNQSNEDPLMIYSPVVETRGLDESVIRLIPTFQFKKGAKAELGEKIYFECAVCLGEFQEEEKLRILPNCSHLFHIDCIDVWLQNNSNCPLCRSSISLIDRFKLDQIAAPTSSPQDPNTFSDDDFVVIEIREDNNNSSSSSSSNQERLNSGEISFSSISPKQQNRENRGVYSKKGRKFLHNSSMGDECIDIRSKDEQFSIQPIRRSFSMDSSGDRQLYLSIQEIVQQHRRHLNEVRPPSEGCSSRVRRSIFSFGHVRGSRSAVQPIDLEP